MIFDDNDIAAILQPFATKFPVRAHRDSGDEIRFTAIFDNSYREYGDNLELSGYMPRLICRTIDVVNIDQYDIITVNDVDYRLRDSHPDSTGNTILDLKK